MTAIDHLHHVGMLANLDEVTDEARRH